MKTHGSRKPVIIEASLNGNTPRDSNPNVPYSDDEIVADAIACNITLLDEEGLFAATDYLYRNDAADSRYYVETCRALNIGLSISIFEPGFLKFVLAYLRAGKLPAGSMIKFYFAADHLPFGLPPTDKSLDAYLAMLEGFDVPWSVSAFGADCTACGLTEAALVRGGHIQVGLEPYGGPRTPTNVELVREVVALAERHDRPIATPEVAAEMLGLPVFPVPFGAATLGAGSQGSPSPA